MSSRKTFVATIILIATAVAVSLAVYWLLFPFLAQQWRLWLGAIAGAIVVAIGLIRNLLGIMGTSLPQLLSRTPPGSDP